MDREAQGRDPAITRGRPTAATAGPIGSGHGWWSWIDLEDVLGAIEHVLHSSLEGPLNIVSPTPVQQEEFARTLGRVLRRPAFLPVPAPAVKAMLGEMGREVLLASQRARPTRLAQDGFTHLHPHLEDALRAMLGHSLEGRLAVLLTFVSRGLPSERPLTVRLSSASSCRRPQRHPTRKTHLASRPCVPVPTSDGLRRGFCA